MLLETNQEHHYLFLSSVIENDIWKQIKDTGVIYFQRYNIFFLAVWHKKKESKGLRAAEISEAAWRSFKGTKQVILNVSQ